MDFKIFPLVTFWKLAKFSPCYTSFHRTPVALWIAKLIADPKVRQMCQTLLFCFVMLSAALVEIEAQYADHEAAEVLEREQQEVARKHVYSPWR